MNTNIEVGMAGKYKFQACKVDADGIEIVATRRDVTGWFDNIITDIGLDSLGASTTPQSRMVQCRVGSGSAVPTASDTALVAEIATTTTLQAAVNGVSGASPYYGYYRKTFRFGLGVAAGNLSEVAIFGGTGNTICFSRALIADGGGTPTTITILSDEILDVIYEFRIYAPLDDVAYGPLTISGTDYSGTIRAANVNSTDYFDDGGQIVNSGTWAMTGVSSVGQGNGASIQGCLIRGVGTGLGSRATPLLFATQTLGPLTGTISGTAYSGTTITASPYTSGTYYADHEILVDLNEGNVPGGIGSALINTKMGTYQVSFSPVFAKDVTKRLRLNVRVSWGRYAP